MELRQGLLALGTEWKEQAEQLEESLFGTDVRCIRFSAEQMRKQAYEINAVDTLLITDDRLLAADSGKRGIACIGCDDGAGVFFEGACLVTDTPETLDVRTLEECLLRATGRPVTIAVTDRLIIREIEARDIPGLYQLSRQDGMQQAMDTFGENCFEPERMAAYIRYVYRFYGYGLWSVLLRDGTLVGCCGFTDFAEDSAGRQEPRGQEKAAGRTKTAGSDGNARHAWRKGEPPTRLELQYAVAENDRRQGYGEEMCRAALAYARSRLHADEVWVRVKKENRASEALAKKLGFVPARSFGDCPCFFILQLI